MIPGGDGKGPGGMGPLTGRGAGFCDESDKPKGYMNYIPGGGMGFGRGGGRGMRRMFWYGGVLPACLYLANRWRRFGYDASYQGASEVPFDEKDLLTRQKESLQEQLNILEKKLERLNDER